MIYKPFHWLFLTVFACLSCQKASDYLADALRRAGKNRPELEKTLAHYRQNPHDVLKYKAAVFLIENMPGHYSFTGYGLDDYRRMLQDFALRNDFPVTDPDVWPVVFSDVLEEKYTTCPFPFLDREYDVY